MDKKHLSLKWALMTAILTCWIAAVIIVITIAGVLINYNYKKNLEEQAVENAEGILNQIEIRLSDSLESSKKISYDGVVRGAYSELKKDGDSIKLYRTVTQYLSGNFSRDAKFEAVFISFWEDEVNSRLYVINRKNNSYQILQNFISGMRPRILSEMKEADTDIRFLVRDGALYLCRNLLDAKYKPYATVTMLCDNTVLFQPLLTLAAMGETRILLDGDSYWLKETGELEALEADSVEKEMYYSTSVDGHDFAYYVAREDFRIWTDMPGLGKAFLLAIVLVIPILGALIIVFSRMVTKPVQTLVDACQKVTAGERGYRIECAANSMEFQTLYGQFNTMSEELKTQFELSKLEQQALQQAQIRALQSQINPHFLNNTLEVINWEARMAGNDKVSDMIDALSTMLMAALDRNGVGTVPLAKEMEYVDAYLTIINRRLGNRLTVEKDIDPRLIDRVVPKLMLQPIVENAVEHDLTPRRGGSLLIRAREVNGRFCMEVEHEGRLTENDRENIREILTFTKVELAEFRIRKDRHVGLRNVAMRLKLLYRDEGFLKVEETENGMIRATIVLPLT